MSKMFWLSRVTLLIKAAQYSVDEVSSKDLTKSSIEGYFRQEIESEYGGIKQRWLLVESQKRKESAIIKLSEKI